MHPYSVNFFLRHHKGAFFQNGVYPRLVCQSGLSFSVQVGHYVYCEPRNPVGPWTSVEVGYPSSFVPEIMKYAEDRISPLDTVYGYVPVEVLERVIRKNGGIESHEADDAAEDDSDD